VPRLVFRVDHCEIRAKLAQAGGDVAAIKRQLNDSDLAPWTYWQMAQR